MAGDIGGTKKGGGIVAINIVPLVDIMLVLLIIFMVTAVVQNSKNVPVQVPKASTGASGGAAPITLAVDKSGTLRAGRPRGGRHRGPTHAPGKHPARTVPSRCCSPPMKRSTTPG